MSKTFLFLLSFIWVFNSYATSSDSCYITINKQLIYSGVIDEPKATVYLKSSGINKRDCFSIQYVMEEPDNFWDRTIYLSDLLDNNIQTLPIPEQSGCVNVKASAFWKMIANKEAVFIYAVSIPKDREVAARVRVKRRMLCKIEWN